MSECQGGRDTARGARFAPNVANTPEVRLEIMKALRPRPEVSVII
jgi:hypothetical protein